MKKEVISFRKEINASKTDVLQERIKSDGTIEEIRVRFYQGVQKSLQVEPFIEHKGHQIEQMISYPSTTDQFISGDDDYFIYPVSVPVEYDDFIKVKAKNITHDFSKANTWVSGIAYAVGDQVLPTSDNGFFYECIVAGTSGVSEPTWATTEGEETTDNTVTWVAKEKGHTYTLVVDVVVDYLGGKTRVV